jgi:hypothetical protein
LNIEFRFLAICPDKTTIEKNLNIMSYEVASAYHCYELMMRDGAAGNRANLMAEIGDITAQIRLFCELYKIPYMAPGLTGSNSNEFYHLDNPADIFLRLFIKVAKLGQCYHYTDMFGNSNYHGSIPVEANQVFFGAKALCEFFRFDFDVVCTMGEEKYAEKMHDIRKHWIAIGKLKEGQSKID